MNQTDNQSIIIEGGSEVALDGMLNDLNVQSAEAIKGGPSRPAGGGGADIIVFDIVDSHH